jgi:lipopolysaccharide transport system ATP-binding protein
MGIAVKAEGLSKSYIIRHDVNNQYETLLDVISRRSKQLVGKLTSQPDVNGIDEQASEVFWALDNIDFEIEQGDKVGIIGKNGAGKSTLLKILSRITEPTRGRVCINGRIASLLEVGTGFHPELTGRENIYLNGAILGMSKSDIAKRFDEIVAFAEVERFLDTPVKRYSSGMYVRLAFAVAAHLEPDILIVDEVLAVGDSAFQQKCIGKVREVGNEGRTIIFVSHNMEIIRPLCQRALLLQNGKIIDDGEVSSVITHYMETTKDKQYSINDYTDREGTGEILVSDVAIEYSQKKARLTTHDAIDITIKANVSEEYRNGKQVDVGVGIDTIDGRRIFTAVNSWSGITIHTEGVTLLVKCAIPSLPLVPGRYLVSVSIIDNNKYLDAIIHCGEFTIVDDSDEVYFTKKDKSYGDIDIPHQFIHVK